MFKEAMDCIDAGTEFCPCHLAESNECILCSQLQGSNFCDCSNWKGVCIYQELYNNGGKAKEGRKLYSCNVVESKLYQPDVLLLNFEVPHKLAIDLAAPGSFIFVRTDDSNVYFDVPISILESDIEKNIVTIMIEIRGIKTKKLLEIKSGDKINIRGPYWNGVFGIKNIKNLKNSNALILARGIGMAPMMPVIRKLCHANNKVTVVVDKTPFTDIYVKDYLSQYDVNILETNLLGKGELSDKGRVLIKDYIDENDVKLVHVAGADILSFKIIEYMDELDRKDIALSCCNNYKMCCGEGVCGSCTQRFSGHRVKRFCKVQSDPRNVFEGRRYI
ncbi:MAG: sulfide/dihydroorotate dehydrogenase-like FAD/NAD-binding protein [Clostridium sp.]